eukprot:1159717-Pelagomonas_calceolata.AAC.4
MPEASSAGCRMQELIIQCGSKRMLWNTAMGLWEQAHALRCSKAGKRGGSKRAMPYSKGGLGCAPSMHVET